MKALLNANQFKQLIEATKHAVDTTSARPILAYIKLDIKGSTITAYACDGYRLAKAQVTNSVYAEDNKDEFTVFIKPLAVPKQTTDMLFPIEIEKDDDIVTVAMQTKDGKIELNFKQPAGEYVNAEKVIADAGEHDEKVVLNARYVAAAMTAIAKSTQDRSNCAIIQTSAAKGRSVIITGKGTDIEVTQLVLPIKRVED